MDSLPHILRALFGLACLIGMAWLCSADRKRISWRLVGSGLLLQLGLALLLLRFEPVRKPFSLLAAFFVQVLNFTDEGSAFLFGGLVTDTQSFGYLFAFKVLPTIVFFSALTSLLYYLGILQKVVYAFAWLMQRTLRLSGAETLAAAANVFVGQTEAPLVVKPYLERMSRSEMLCLMTGGMATIAGAVLAAYVGLLGGEDPEQRLLFANHLLIASILSAPAALIMAKIILPEKNKVDQALRIPRHEAGSNLLDAIATGTTQGVKLAVNVGAMLLVFIALLAMVNFLLEHAIGAPTGLNERIATWTDGRYDGLSLQLIFGLAFTPIAWIIGVPQGELMAVGQLLGEKTILNEFVAYVSLAELREAGAITSERGSLIATYALCGFANFASIGIQIGGIGALAPGQRRNLSELALRALIGGTLACLMTACIAAAMI